MYMYLCMLIMLILHQAPVSPTGSHTPISFTSEDPALLRHRPMPYGLKPAQLNWQKEVTYDERGNIIDMIKLDPATFPLRRYWYIITSFPGIDLKGEVKEHLFVACTMYIYQGKGMGDTIVYYNTNAVSTLDV